MKKKSIWIFALPLLAVFLGMNVLNSQTSKPALMVSKQDIAINFSPKMYQLLSMGNNRLLSSFLWVQTLLESDLEHYKKKDLNSWLYLRFDNIIKLEPKFLAAYLFGGQYLSIIKDDLQGAKDIYERGLKVYPDHYDLNFQAAFHYMFELGTPKKAIPLYEKIQLSPLAPPYLPSLITKIKLSEGTSLQEVYQLLLENYQRIKEGSPSKKIIHTRLYSIKAELDLNCLNESKKNCSQRDFDGTPYIKEKGKYQAVKSWAPYRPYNSKNFK